MPTGVSNIGGHHHAVGQVAIVCHSPDRQLHAWGRRRQRRAGRRPAMRHVQFSYNRLARQCVRHSHLHSPCSMILWLVILAVAIGRFPAGRKMQAARCAWTQGMLSNVKKRHNEICKGARGERRRGRRGGRHRRRRRRAGRNLARPPGVRGARGVPVLGYQLREQDTTHAGVLSADLGIKCTQLQDERTVIVCMIYLSSVWQSPEQLEACSS